MRPDLTSLWYFQAFDSRVTIIRSARSPFQRRLLSFSGRSTTGQPLVLFLRQFTWEFLCSCLYRDVQRHTKHAEASVYSFASSPHPGMKSASRPAGKRSLHGQDRRPLKYTRLVETRLKRLQGLLFPGRIVLLAPNLARPRPGAPPGAPTRLARGTSGF